MNRVNSSGFAPFSNDEGIFDGNVSGKVYATLEENFTKLDGSMYFIPRKVIIVNRLISSDEYILMDYKMRKY